MQLVKELTLKVITFPSFCTYIYIYTLDIIQTIQFYYLFPIRNFKNYANIKTNSSLEKC